MKPIALILLLALWGNCRSQQPGVDVLHYDFNITLSDASDTIDCSALIRCEVNTTPTSLNFDLVSRNAAGKGMKVTGVWDGATRQPIGYTHAGDVLKISNGGVPAGRREIRIQYRGIPADGLIISKNKYNQRTFFSDNWPNRARNWLVCHDHPSDKASVDFIVTAPAHYQVVANGVLVEETNINESLRLSHWQETADLPMKVMGFGAAAFAVNYAGDVGNVPVYSWVYPADRDKGFADYGLATRVLPFFVNNIAPYPYRKLANVESKTIFGGMENAGAIFYSEKSITGKGGLEELLAHEIAHQWFGNMATEADWPHVWLSEGFATYFALLYLESRYGPDTLTSKLLANREKVIAFYKKVQRPIVDSVTTRYMDLLNPNSYEKGGWVLHMLRRQLGDSAFWKGIRMYYHEYAGKNAVTDDFRKVMERVSGRDLQQFFRQWLYTEGHPVLHIDQNFSDQKLTITITQQQRELFQFPLAFVVRSAGGDITKSVRVAQRTTSFTLPMDSPPSAVIIDPFTALLFEQK